MEVLLYIEVNYLFYLTFYVIAEKCQIDDIHRDVENFRIFRSLCFLFALHEQAFHKRAKTGSPGLHRCRRRSRYGMNDIKFNTANLSRCATLTSRTLSPFHHIYAHK